MPRTLSSELIFTGTGLHSGATGTVIVSPLEKEGLYFSTENGLYPLSLAQIEEDSRLTGFSLPDGTRIRTAEHLLAAIVGMDIDSALIKLRGEEVPILDGSPYPFAAAFAEVGTREFGESAGKAVLAFPVVIDDLDKGRIIMAVPSERLRVTYVIDYPGTPVGTQMASYDITPEVFLETVSKARTFGLTSEIEYLKKSGLAKGGSLENALIFGEMGLLNEGGLRFPLECVTHKINDLLGDLSLIGRIPTAHYIGIRAGHELHGRLVDRIKRVL